MWNTTKVQPSRGLVESVADFLPDAQYQRCMVHFYRNVFSHVPSTRVREVSHMLKAIHAQESREAADKKARRSSTTCEQARWSRQPTSSSRPLTRH
jgi:transposase-like protein